MTEPLDVEAEFDRAAPGYDLLVGLNPGYHRQLRSAAAALLPAVSPPTGPDRADLHVLDLGCGSGASTRALLHAAAGRRVRITGVDASAEMLAQARRKSWPDGVDFVHGRAETVAAGTEVDSPVDGILAAYLFRNVPAGDRDDLAADLLALLRPGGVLVVQDYLPATRIDRALWTFICWAVIIPLARLVSPRSPLYRYLWRSVLDNDHPHAFAGRLVRAGFTDVEMRRSSGWQRGILRTVRARRPV